MLADQDVDATSLTSGASVNDQCGMVGQGLTTIQEFRTVVD